MTTISCAYRAGILDEADRPCVWVLGRRGSDNGLVCRLAPQILSDHVHRVNASLTHNMVNVSEVGGAPVFSAEMRTCPNNEVQSEVFHSSEEFGAFIRDGVVSYTESTRRGFLTRVDLIKEETGYRPIKVTVNHSKLGAMWKNSGIKFDSAFSTEGGAYRWTFKGLVPMKRQSRNERGKLHGELLSQSPANNMPSPA